MYEFTGFGLYKYGYLQDLEKLSLEEISEYYFELLKTCKIDIFISGNFDENHVKEILNQNQAQKLYKRWTTLRKFKKN